MLTQAIEDCLKVIYKLRQAGEAVTTNAVAARLNVTPASASNMVKKLARFKHVDHTPYHCVQLTSEVEKIALEVIRHHRLIELYLARHLGIGLDRVDEEAERLEHVISEELEERIAQSLGDPTYDPHGDPIPTREGAVEAMHHPLLSDMHQGERGVVVRLRDSVPSVLRGLSEARLLPGAMVEVIDVHAYGPLRLRAEDACGQACFEPA